MINDIELLSEKEVSKMLGKSTAWLQRARWSGDYALPYRKIGRNVKYLKGDVLNWLENNVKTYTATSQYKN